MEEDRAVTDHPKLVRFSATDYRALELLSEAMCVSTTEAIRILIRAAVADTPIIRDLMIEEFRKRVEGVREAASKSASGVAASAERGRVEVAA